MRQKAQSLDSEWGTFFYPRNTTVCTKAFSRFLQDHHLNIDYFMFIIRLVGSADEGRVRAAKALLAIGKTLGRDDVARIERLQKTADDPDAALRELKRFARVNSQNLTNGVVNGFQRYFSEIIQLAILRRPELLRSGKSIRVDEVLRFKRHAELVSFLVDRKINELSYAGIKGLESYFRDRLGIEMVPGDEARTLLTIFIELRNINVHNAGFINDLFLQRVPTHPSFSFEKGTYFHVDMDTLILLANNAIRTALAIDEAVAKKFKLQRKSHHLWVKPRSKKNAATSNEIA